MGPFLAAPTAVGHDVMSLTPWAMATDVYFCKICGGPYILQNRDKINIKKSEKKNSPDDYVTPRGPRLPPSLDYLQQLVHSDLHPQNEERKDTVAALVVAGSLAAKCSVPSGVAQSWGSLSLPQPNRRWDPPAPLSPPSVFSTPPPSAGVRWGRDPRR
jgi:hypothetical protein